MEHAEEVKSPASAPSALNVGLAAMTLDEVTERMLAMEGAVQRVMAIVAMALPHTDQHLAAMDSEWGRIIKDIERDHDKAANVGGNSAGACASPTEPKAE